MGDRLAHRRGTALKKGASPTPWVGERAGCVGEGGVAATPDRLLTCSADR